MFANPLGLIALAAVPAVVALHLFRRRFRPREVSALFLWGELDATPVAGRTRERLIRSPSFWLELLAALALALALAGPRFGRPELQVPHLVAVIDGSASMLGSGASPQGLERQASAARLAREALDRRLAEAGSRARATVIVSGPRPALLAGPAAPASLAREALDRPPPAHAAHDLAPALELAARFAGEAGQVLLYTDRAEAAAADPLVERIALGRPLDNTGLLRASREPLGDGRERLSIVVGRFAGGPGSARLEVLAADASREAAPLAVRELQLAAAGRMHLELELPALEQTLTLALASDDFTPDDTLLLAPPDPRPLQAWIELDAQRAAELGETGADFERLLAALGGARLAASPASAEFALGVGGAPRAAQALVIAAPAEGLATQGFVGPYLIESAHPLMEGLTLDGVAWTAATEFPLTGTPLVLAGSLPLIVEQRRAGTSELRLNLDPARSNFTRSPDWPILLANLGAAARARRPGPSVRHLSQGQALRVNGVQGRRLRLSGPGTDQTILSAAEAVAFEAVERPGLYLLQLDDEPAIPISVALEDPRESDLRARSAGLEPSAAAAASIASDTHPYDLALGAIALALLLADWLVLGGASRRLAPGAGALAARGGL